MRIRHHEELVAPKDHNSPRPRSYPKVLRVPFVEIFVALVDQQDLIRKQRIFVFWFRWINDIPEPFVQEIEIIIDQNGKAWEPKHPRLTINEGEKYLQPESHNIYDAEHGIEGKQSSVLTRNVL